MLNENQLTTLHKSLQRVFTLPVTRSSFREVQNVIFSIVEGQGDNANKCLEILLTGKITAKGAEENIWKEIIDQFSIPCWVAKEVHDKGEFLNLITSDILTQGNQVIFSNFVKRVDGKELQIVTDLESTLQVLQHFVNRLQEGAQGETTKESYKKYKPQLENIAKQIGTIINGY